MKPKLNKLITLLLILGTFAFSMEAEERVFAAAEKGLSEWASLLPVTADIQNQDSTYHYTLTVSMLDGILSEDSKKVNSVNN